MVRHVWDEDPEKDPFRHLPRPGREPVPGFRYVIEIGSGSNSCRELDRCPICLEGLEGERISNHMEDHTWEELKRTRHQETRRP